MELAEGTRCKLLGRIVGLDWTSGNSFDSGLELRWDLVDVLWTDEDAGLLVGLLFEACLSALSDAGGHDVGHVLRELRDVLADSYKESCCAHVISHLDSLLR